MFMPANFKVKDDGQVALIQDALKIYSVCKHVVIVSQYEGDVYFGSLEKVPEALQLKPYSALRLDNATLYIQL